MKCDIEITKDTDGSAVRVEGICPIPGWRYPTSVISLNKMSGAWHVGSSMCLPSNISEARKIQDCVAAVFNALDDIGAQ